MATQLYQIVQFIHKDTPLNMEYENEVVNEKINLDHKLVNAICLETMKMVKGKGFLSSLQSNGMHPLGYELIPIVVSESTLAKPAAKSKAKPKTPTKPAKVAKKAPVAKAIAAKKTPVKKASVKSLKPKAAIAKKVSAGRKAKNNQVRFQSGSLLAVASGKKIILLSIHMDSEKICIPSKVYLEGHTQDINSICWDPINARLVSVSHESAQGWASTSAGWKCVYSLPSGGHVYTSCLFHPLHPQLLCQYIQLWDTSNGNKSKLFQSSCTGFVSALTCFPESGLVASASHDSQAQLWTHLPK
nr:hypothetical protein [Tanacetum cinerariifolium]